MKDLSIYEQDFLFDDTSAAGFETISKSLPHAVTRGSTLIVDGRPQFKDSPKIACPNCGHELKRGKTTITFKYAPADQSQQLVETFVCDCGEAYVPGDAARTAYHRAMQTTDAIAASGLTLAEFANELRTLSTAKLYAVWKMQCFSAAQKDEAAIQKREAILQEASRRRAELQLAEWFVCEIIADSVVPTLGDSSG